MLNPWKERRSEDGEAVEGSDAEQPADVDQDVLNDPEVDGNPEAAVVEVEAESGELHLAFGGKHDVLGLDVPMNDSRIPVVLYGQ